MLSVLYFPLLSSVLLSPTPQVFPPSLCVSITLSLSRYASSIWPPTALYAYPSSMATLAESTLVPLCMYEFQEAFSWALIKSRTHFLELSWLPIQWSTIFWPWLSYIIFHVRVYEVIRLLIPENHLERETSIINFIIHYTPSCNL